jgi:hypothetical protein
MFLTHLRFCELCVASCLYTEYAREALASRSTTPEVEKALLIVEDSDHMATAPVRVLWI